MRLSSLEIAGVRSDPDLESGALTWRVGLEDRAQSPGRADILVDIRVDIEKF